MEKIFISQSRQPRLIILFLGWGMDANPFTSLHKEGFDVLVVYDYTGFDNEQTNRRELDALTSIATGYDEIVVVAWSFGVRIAADFLSRSRAVLPITGAIAVNGTTTHIHNSRGIPEAIFDGTLRNLSPASVRKFNRRMFASAEAFALYMQHAPQRSFESLLVELQTFANLKPIEHNHLFSLAVIGGADAIFPTPNQLNGWLGAATETIDDAPHFCDLQHIITNRIVDKEMVATRFSRAAATYADNAGPQQTVAAQLWNMAREAVTQALSTSSQQNLLLEIGSGSGTLTKLYLPHIPAGTVCELWDLTEQTDTVPGTRFRQCDAETEICIIPERSCRCILSASTIQWFNSPADFMPRMAHALSPGGVAAIALYGPQTYREIATLTGRGLRYLSLQQLTGAASGAGLEVLHAIDETISLSFPDAAAMLRHIKQTGVNGNSSSIRLAMKVMRTFPPSAPVSLTYNPIYLILKRHE